MPQSGTDGVADILDLYLKNVKEQLGLYTGRILWTGNAVGFMMRLMGRNMVAKVPSDMARKLGLSDPKSFFFH